MARGGAFILTVVAAAAGAEAQTSSETGASEVGSLEEPATVQSQNLPGTGDPGSGGGSKLAAPPAESMAISPGGVDMRTGTYVYKGTDLSTGEDTQSGGIALTRNMGARIPGHTNAFGNFSHNWDIAVTQIRVNLSTGEFEDGQGYDYRVQVHFGGRSETFEAVNGQGFSQTSRAAYSELTYTGNRDNLTAALTAIYTFKSADGAVATFRSIGSQDCSAVRACAYVSSIVEPDGTRFDFTYDSGGAGTTGTRLRRVTSSRGFALLLQYGSATPMQVSTACVVNLAYSEVASTHACPANAAATASYTYTNVLGTRLASVTDPTSRTSTYGYTAQGSDGLQMTFTKPGAAQPWLTHTVALSPSQEGVTDELIVQQLFNGGESYSYGWQRTPQVDNVISSVAGGTMTDSAGRQLHVLYEFPIMPQTWTATTMPHYTRPVSVNEIVYQQTPGPTRIIDPLGHETYSHYCDPNAEDGYDAEERHKCLVSLLQWYRDPEGIVSKLTYDGFRNVIQVRRKAKPNSTLDGAALPDIVTSATHDCSSYKFCAKPKSLTDANQKTTDFTYSSDHGGVLTETGPAVNGVRPQKRYEYQQRYARLKSGTGLVQAATPVWVPTATSFCRNSAATGVAGSPCATAGDEVRTVYEYGAATGPDALLVKGVAVTADGVTLRTCYTYDQRGRRISETAPAANIAVCP